MYTITLEVNQICNLRCSYCYLGEKSNRIMTDKVAHQGLEIAFLNVEKHKDRRLWVDFVGGEALLSFSFLRKLVEYIEKTATERNITVSYSITTNGSIMTNEILVWLIKNRVHLKLSIDGKAEIHDRNRKTIAGAGSYASIAKNIAFFKEYETQAEQYIQVAHVITQNNYEEAFESVSHLVENLGFKVVDSSIDVVHRWTKEQLDRLADEWKRILLYFIKRSKEGNEFLWGPFLDLQKYDKVEKSGFCGVGIIRTYISVDGKIFGCAANLAESGCLGDVERGVSIEKIKQYRQLAQSTEICLDCNVHRSCQNKKCIMNSLAYSGRTDGYNPDMCYFENKKIKIWEEYQRSKN